jgi:hypothetical protein
LLQRDDGVLSTASKDHNVEACVKLRNFSTHGGTTSNSDGTDVLDGELTRRPITLLGAELSAYWADLTATDGDVRDQLAQALVRPLFTPGHMVFVADMHGHIAGGGLAGADIVA